MDKITFKDLGLAQNVLNGIEAMGYVSPSPIQEKQFQFYWKVKILLDRLKQEQEKHWLLGVFFYHRLLKGKVCSSFDFITNKRTCITDS